MSDRSYAVVVLPDAWSGSLEELASQMMPVTRRGPNQVLPLLERGPMTLEADLSVDEAGLLQARLNNLGVPAQVTNGDGEVVAASAHDGSKASQPGPESDAKGASGGRVRLPKPKKLPESKPEPEPEPDQAGSDEWANVFAGMKGSKDEPADKPKRIKSLDELTGDEGDGFGAEPAPKASPEPPSPSPPSPKTKPPKSQSPKSPPPKTKPPKLSKPSPPAQPPSPGPKGSRSKPERRKPERSKLKPSPKTPASFDAGKMSDALNATRGEKPPYAPDGFDDSMSHIPALAAFLSLIAPGAGQVYNGQDEQAREYGVRFALLTPWYDSVRQAHAYAEKIRTYWAPLPKAGALVAAFKYLVIWWVVVGTVLAGLGWAGTKLYNVAKTPEAPKITKADVGRAVEDARSKVHMARIGGLDGITAFLDERSRNHKRFTMTKAERAQRLFRRGVVYCKKGNYATCESAMKRVTVLSPKLRRDAYRLQAWASAKVRGAANDEPMPEVDVTDSLEEFEQTQGVQEAADAGAREVDADAPPEDATAPTDARDASPANSP